MRGAVNKVKAGNALLEAGDMQEERKSPRGGYNELVDENGSAQLSIGDEENQLL